MEITQKSELCHLETNRWFCERFEVYKNELTKYLMLRKISWMIDGAEAKTNE
jgi:hypothetical protein